MDSLTPFREQIMLERRGTVVCVDHVARLLFDLGNPLDEFSGIGDGGWEEDKANVRIEEDDGFFPDHASFFVSHIMDFVENDPFDLELLDFYS